MKYLFNRNNPIKDATLTVTNMLPSNTYFVDSAVKTGGGNLGITGDYTGTADAVFDIEVMNTTIVGTPNVSLPEFTGVGNGEIDVQFASAFYGAQQLKITCIDLGTDTRNAYVPFQGVTLKAKTSGTGGNSITITIDETALAEAATNYSLLDEVQQGVNEYIGDHWNFGAAVLNPDGTIPTSAPRLTIGDDPQVYRQYKFFRDGRYVYSFSPAPVRAAQRGSKIHSVTGSRTVTVTNGVATDTYASVITLYSLLSQIQADGDALLEVDGVVANDLRPNGMGIDDLSVRTTSFVATLRRDGTQYVRDAVINLDISASAPTETLTIRCADASLPGSEKWAVIGTVSSELLRAQTGVAYADGHYSFTIPQALPTAVLDGAQLHLRYEPLGRGDDEGTPTPYIENLVPGAQASDSVFEFVWRPRPIDCDPVDVDGGPNCGILGTCDEGDDMGTIPDPLLTPLKNLYQWHATFVAANAAILTNTTQVDDSTINASGQVVTEANTQTVSGTLYRSHLRERVSAVLRVDRVDIEFAKAVTNVFHGALRHVYDTLATNSVPSSAMTKWNNYLTALDTETNIIDGLIGADFWREYESIIGSELSNRPEEIAGYGAKVLTQVFDAYLAKFKAQMLEFYTDAGVEPDFDSATLGGNEVWRDYGDTHWFESQDGLLPIQLGHYYHSAKLQSNGAGDPVPVSTQQFGIGLNFECADLLKVGDKIFIHINVSGNVRATYQVGDTFEADVVTGSPLQLGGGQTGNDTLTFSVKGTGGGIYSDYSCYKPSPINYTTPTLVFKITPGGIPFALGDEFSFWVEGGQFRWRKNGGSWSSSTQINPTVALSDGISILFNSGESPSFVPSDFYTIKALAVNGPENIRTLKDGALRFLNGSDGQIVVDRGFDIGVSIIFLRTGGGVDSASAFKPGAGLTITASNSPAFTPAIYTTSVSLTRKNEFLNIPFTNARYWKLEFDDQTASVEWLAMGDTDFESLSSVLGMVGGGVEHGKASRSFKPRTKTKSRGYSYRIEHTFVDESNGLLDAIKLGIENAFEYEDGRIVVVEDSAPSYYSADRCAILELNPDSFEIEESDLFDLQSETRYLQLSIAGEPLQ